jgi:hypothetical protein
VPRSEKGFRVMLVFMMFSDTGRAGRNYNDEIA